MMTTTRITLLTNLFALLSIVLIAINSNVDGSFLCQQLQRKSRAGTLNRNGREGKCNRIGVISAGQGKDMEDMNNLSEADKERLLLTEPALNAFIVAEMKDFVTERMTYYDENPAYSKNKWRLNQKEKIKLGLIDKDNFTVINDEYIGDSMDSAVAVDLICNTTQIAFRECFNDQPGLLSALGSAILYFRNYYRETPQLLSACERVGLSDYDIAHHITDMYHHRSFRGAYTKTLAPSGKGEIAARLAVGLNVPYEAHERQDKISKDTEIETMEAEGASESDEEFDDDECLVWSPTTPGVCLHWKSDDDAWRKRRFEKIQMEGTRDPRRGGSGTTR